MIKKILKYLLLFFTFLFCNTYASEKLSTKFSPDKILKKKLDSLVNSELKDVFVGIKIENLKTNKVIYEINQDKLFRPASNQKLLTSAAAIEYLPENFSFKTKVFIKGQIEDTVLLGDIFVKGTGDPLFQLSDIDSIVSFLKAKNIKKITGNLIGDISYFDSQYWGRGWMWDDEPEPFAPHITPLNINSNVVTITVTPAEIIGKSAMLSVSPDNAIVKTINYAITASAEETLSINVERSRNENVFTISGKIPINQRSKEYSLSIYKPEEFFMGLFKERLEKNQIIIFGNVYIDTFSYGELVYETGHSIDEVLNQVNKNSNNLAAEVLYKVLSAEQLKIRGTNSASAQIIKKFLNLASIDTSKVVIADGSGISRYNLISPNALTKVIKYFYQTDSLKFKRLINSLAVSGVDGTLKNRIVMLGGRVFAKTGTHSDATALTGVYFGKSGNLILFSIIINNYVNNLPSTNRYKIIEEEILKIIAKYY